LERSYNVQASISYTSSTNAPYNHHVSDSIALLTVARNVIQDQSCVYTVHQIQVEPCCFGTTSITHPPQQIGTAASSSPEYASATSPYHCTVHQRGAKHANTTQLTSNQFSCNLDKHLQRQDNRAICPQYRAVMSSLSTLQPPHTFSTQCPQYTNECLLPNRNALLCCIQYLHDARHTLMQVPAAPRCDHWYMFPADSLQHCHDSGSYPVHQWSA